ncbi:MAG: O-antigen ligase family protein [Parcubacteria group bacterium]|nr:O-antigen ligase family protein [Parcubacteria group bacterium]
MNTLLLFIAFVIYTFLVFRHFKLALLIFISLLPLYITRAFAGSYTVLMEIPFLILLIGFLFLYFQTIKKKFSRTIDRSAWRWIVAVWVAISFIQIFVSSEPAQAFNAWRIYFLEPTVLFIMIASVLEKKDVLKIIFAFSVTAFIVALYAVIQKITGFGIVAEYWNAPEQRVTSFFSYQNAIGLLLGPLIALFIGVMISDKTFSHRLWFGVVAVLSFFAIIFARSEGAIFAIIFVCLIFFLARASTRRFTFVCVALIALALIISQPIRNYAISKITLKDFSGSIRRELWSETITMLKDSSLFGAGLSGFPAKIAPYHQDKKIEIYWYPHNIFLNFLSEIGIAGILLFFFILWQFYQDLYKQKKTPYALTIGAAMAIIFIHGLVDVPYFKNDLSMLFWTIIGMGYIIKK